MSPQIQRYQSVGELPHRKDMGGLVVLPEGEVPLHIAVDDDEYLEDVLLDGEVEVEGALECADEEAHPQLEGAVEAGPHQAVLDAVQGREALYYLQHQA